MADQNGLRTAHFLKQSYPIGTVDTILNSVQIKPDTGYVLIVR